MEDRYSEFVVTWVREEARDMRLLSLDGAGVWAFVPGQVAVLRLGAVGESYFAIASAPEDQGGMEFLIRRGNGVAGALYEAREGDRVEGKGPVGRGFDMARCRGRDLLLVAVGSAISPMRSVLRHVCRRGSEFGRVVLLYGARELKDVPFREEMKMWEESGIGIVVSLSSPSERGWGGRIGHVQAHFAEMLSRVRQPVALICGMKAMMNESRDGLVQLGVLPSDVLTNF